MGKKGVNNPRPGLGVVIEKICWKKEEMFLQAKTGVTLHRRVFDWFRKNSEKKEIGVKVCVSNNKALVSYSSSVTD